PAGRASRPVRTAPPHCPAPGRRARRLGPASRLRSRQYLSDAVGHGGNLPATRRHAQGLRGPLLIGVKRLVETPSLRSALPTRPPGGKRSRSEWSCPALQQGEEHVDVEHRSKTL